MQQDLFSFAGKVARASARQILSAGAAQSARDAASERGSPCRSERIETNAMACISSDPEMTMPTEAKDLCASSMVQGEGSSRDGDDDRDGDGTRRDVETYVRRLIKTVRRSDRHALRSLLKVPEKVGTPLQDISLTVAFLAETIEMYGLHGRPLTFARQMLICLGRLVSSHEVLKCLVYERVEDKRLRVLPECDWPTRFRGELNAWKQSVPVKTRDAANPTGALTARKIKKHGLAAVSSLSALWQSGAHFSDESGILFCFRPEAVAIWEPFLFERQQKSTVRDTLAGVLRIARDMHAEASCIGFLEARLAAIGAARLTAVAEPENLLPLTEVPEALMRKAEDPRRQTFSRLAAGRSALAFQLMWEHPDLSEKNIVELDLRSQIGGSGSERTLLRPGSEAPERLSLIAAQFVERLLNVYGLLSVSSPYLLPDRDGRLCATRGAMQLVYHQIQSVLFSPSGSRRCRIT